ncbi:MAG: hypothetical protein ACXVBW_04325, partial [Bdellovibrionota bacterium]
TDRDWRELFYGKNSAADAVFPPANVPAQIAFDALVSSPRSASDLSDSWDERLPLVTGLFSTGYLERQYWRGEVATLPSAFDLLGLILHLTQDLTVPQHAEGTADYCHQEYENLVDRLACNTNYDVDQTPYQLGTYGSRVCQNLYDPGLVEKILGEMQFLDPRTDESVYTRLRALALLSARWQWGYPEDSVDPIETILPDNEEFTGTQCATILDEASVHRQLRYQYNLGVAASAAIFEFTAHSFEKAHSRFLFQPLLDMFRR